jgi:hypothetical protein
MPRGRAALPSQSVPRTRLMQHCLPLSSRADELIE